MPSLVVKTPVKPCTKPTYKNKEINGGRGDIHFIRIPADILSPPFERLT